MNVPSQYSSDSCPVNDIQISYFDIGGGDACLFLHGSRDRKDGFLPLFESLETDLRKIAIDLRGHGDTDKSKGGYNYEQYIDDIHEFIRMKNITSFNLIGHSLGGVLSILFTLKYPLMIKKLVLLGTSVSFSPTFKRPTSTQEITPQIIRETNIRAKPFFFLPEFKDVEYEVLKNWSEIPPHVHKALIAMGHPDLTQCVASINVPTLLIYGEKDKLCPPNKGLEINSLIKNSILEIIEGAGHFMFMEKPKQISNSINKFLLL